MRQTESVRVPTGIAGLDYILRGGLLAGRVYLVYGEPGTGKTTLGLHFLSSGPAGPSEPSGDGGLLITFAQTAEHLRSDANALGLNIENVTILDLTPPPETFAEMQTYDVFSPGDVERGQIS